MGHLLSCANFGSAALRRNLSIFLPMPLWEVQESSRWVRGGQGGRNGETPGGFGLWPPGPFLGGGGEPGLWGEKRSVLSADHGGSFQTWQHPSPSWEDTYLSSPPHPHWPVSITKTLDSTCILDSRSGQRERKYLEEKEFSPRYVCSLPQSLGVSAFLLLCRAHLHQTSLVC